MKYIVTDLATGPYEPELKGQRIARRVLSAVLPQANPDFEGLYNDVRTWWIEVDEGSGLPEREIGLNAEGRPVVAAPFRENLGFWTDSDMFFQPKDYRCIESCAFEAKWKEFERTWRERGKESAV